jgi:osmoprotectant transport system substrate-binding protein
LGPREFVGPALARGLVELIPEYAGSALLFFGVEATKPASAVQQTHEALEKTLQPLHAAALTPAPAQDANAFAVSRATAERYQLHDLSDLARVASKLVFGGPPECPSRPLCLKGLEDVYGVHFKTVVSYLDAGGPVTRQALREGEIGVGLLFTTDPSATSEGLVTLTDDRGLQPAENVTPVVRREVLDRWGAKPQTLIDAVSARLTSSELRELNAEVDRGQPIPAVASRWLDAQEHP